MAHVKNEDWVIELVPQDARYPYQEPGLLDVLRGDAEDAALTLELMAATIAATGCVPQSLDWRNESPACVVRRTGKLRYAVRVDAFEFETDSGYSNGHGWLLARPA